MLEVLERHYALRVPAKELSDSRAPITESVPAALLAVSCMGVAAALFILGRGLIFFFDEWNFVLERREGGLGVFLDGHNGHPSMLPVLVYRLLFVAVGLEHYGAFRVTVILVHLVCVALLYLLVRRRSGPWMALVIASALLVLGRAWEDLLWPFQIGYLSSVAGGIGAAMSLDRHAYRHAFAFTMVAVASSGLGAPVVVAVLAELFVRREWRRLWVGVIPGATFAVWTLTYGDGQLNLDNIRLVPDYTAKAAAAVMGSLTGVSEAWGAWVGGAALAMATLALVRQRNVPGGLAFGIAGSSAFWILTALARGELGSPGSSRYLYPGAAFVLIAVAALIPARISPTTAWFRVGIAIVLVAGWQGVDELREGARALKETSTIVASELRALEEVRAVVRHDFRPDLQRMPQVFAGPYLEAVDDLGSPATPTDIVQQLPVSVREKADAVIAAAVMGQVASPVELPAAGCAVGVAGATDLPLSGVVAGATDVPVEIHLLRFRRSGGGSLLKLLQPGEAAFIRPPTSASTWRLDFRPDRAATLCSNG